MIEEALKQFVDSRLPSGIDSYLAANMGADYKKFRAYIFAINDRNKELAQINSEKEARISKLEKSCEERANEIKMLSNRIEKFEKEAMAAEAAETNAVLSKFNEWYWANPQAPLPLGFVFLAGNIKMREEQNLSESNIETAWIINRGGEKKYLFPNPRFLDDRSNITAFYTNGSGFTNPKGQNKIKIIEPCEIFDYGVIRYPGKLQILP